jgi:hypothetical protein
LKTTSNAGSNLFVRKEKAQWEVCRFVNSDPFCHTDIWRVPTVVGDLYR